MKKEVNHAIRKRFNEVIYHVARYMEILLSVVILGVIALVGIRLVCDVTSREILSMNVDFFTEFLANALSLVVGVEFVKMLCRHSAQTVVEVLMFATARQMVVEHLRTWETLIGVIAIGILFAIRKFLMTEVDDMVYHERNKRKEEKTIMKIGFIGCGNMASAMIGGILKKGIVKKEEIIVSNLQRQGQDGAVKSWVWRQLWTTVRWLHRQKLYFLQ